MYEAVVASTTQNISRSTFETLPCDVIVQPGAGDHPPFVCDFRHSDNTTLVRHRQSAHQWPTLKQKYRRKPATLKHGQRCIRVHYNEATGTFVFPPMATLPDDGEAVGDNGQEAHEAQEAHNIEAADVNDLKPSEPDSERTLSTWTTIFESSPQSSVTSLSATAGSSTRATPATNCDTDIDEEEDEEELELELELEPSRPRLPTASFDFDSGVGTSLDRRFSPYPGVASSGRYTPRISHQPVYEKENIDADPMCKTHERAQISFRLRPARWD